MAERSGCATSPTRRATGCCASCGAAGADGAAVGSGHGRAGHRQRDVTSHDRVRDVLHNFNLDGFDSLYPRCAGGRPPTFTLAGPSIRGPDRHLGCTWTGSGASICGRIPTAGPVWSSVAAAAAARGRSPGRFVCWWESPCTSSCRPGSSTICSGGSTGGCDRAGPTHGHLRKPRGRTSPHFAPRGAAGPRQREQRNPHVDRPAREPVIRSGTGRPMSKVDSAGISGGRCFATRGFTHPAECRHLPLTEDHER